MLSEKQLCEALVVWLLNNTGSLEGCSSNGSIRDYFGILKKVNFFFWASFNLIHFLSCACVPFMWLCNSCSVILKIKKSHFSANSATANIFRQVKCTWHLCDLPSLSEPYAVFLYHKVIFWRIVWFFGFDQVKICLLPLGYAAGRRNGLELDEFLWSSTPF